MGKFIGAPKGHDRYRDPVTHQMTPALYRVRKPYFWKNMLGLAVFSAIPLTVYYFTFKTLSEDEFSDIPIPPIADDELAKLKKQYEQSRS
ncbi:cytochrome oxidase assembly protein 3, mitochondrial [Suhomyces tanzawaensis NRRL Y-17324]|uniref:Cytochrome c oxidase assembly factor 3 n=1 Tax=Suhomyces tanzawaensis NRRL Y-17324 TaxID=984487 RepID=A0A1E4SRC6_9ASCO|nr:cytochrome oxidase assembly protein 3, mitochondrial [Suhomyces tanzawaensis NRRL Y-17324]ODV82066.1 cytochrome oxidase assembly protein 3, mitochondrial [Suhomyces tanzawaensis NRRL Y-17324]